MPNEPALNIPPGYEIVEEADGTRSVRKRADSLLSQTITWRTTTADKNKLLPLVEAFPERTWSAAMQWLLGHPGVQEIIKGKIESSVRSAT